MEQNNIDKLFKDKLASEEVEFNPAAWTAAERMIAQQSGKSAWYAGKAFLSVVIASLLTIGGTVWFTSNESSSGTVSNNNIASTSSNAANEVQTSLVNHTMTDNKKTTTSVTDKIIVSESNTEHSGLSANIPNNDYTTSNNISTNEPSVTSDQSITNVTPPSINERSVDEKNGNIATTATPTNRKGRVSTTFEMSIIEKEFAQIAEVDLLSTDEL
ncbi:MAG: hypothetical protein JKY42_02265, partial [Flavobacteriales bacterium]|nr:hypothetical protein [Flavobacteriales bacterium]